MLSAVKLDLNRVTDEMDELQLWKPAGVSTSGRMYYFNTQTMETAWERPTGAGEAPRDADERPPPSLQNIKPGPSGGPARGRSLTVAAAQQRLGSVATYDELPPFFYRVSAEAVALHSDLTEEGVRECSDIRQASMRGGWVHRGDIVEACERASLSGTPYVLFSEFCPYMVIIDGWGPPSQVLPTFYFRNSVHIW